MARSAAISTGKEDEYEKMSIVSKLAVVCLTAVVAIGGVSAPASAKSKGYVFKYKGVSVTMTDAAKKLIKKAGKPSKKTVKKSCL